jgi:hypothetical protein
MPLNLFSLPREVRDQIYSELLTPSEPHRLFMSHRASDPRHGPRRLGWQETVSLTEYERFYPVILRVSKTIHLEASLLLYASFCFELEDHWNPNKPMLIRFSTYLRRFLQLIGPHNSTLISSYDHSFPRT